MKESAWFWLAILQLIALQGQQERQVTLYLLSFWVTQVLLARIKQISWISEQSNILDIFQIISLLVIIKPCPGVYIYSHFSLKANMTRLLI